MVPNFTDLFRNLFKMNAPKTGYCCNDCFKVLHDVIDGEASAEDVKRLEEHIASCGKCYEHYKIDKSVKELVQHKVAKISPPTHLVDGIKSKIGCK
jgi:mycothiol system anti-sigma-R factor